MLEDIRKWLLEDQWSVTQETAPGTTWSLGAGRRSGLQVTVSQPSGRPDLVQIAAALRPDEQVKAKMMSLPAEDRQAFLWDIKFRLLEMGVEFEGVTDVPERIVVVLGIYHDGLTKDRFAGRISRVHNATLAVVWMFARKFSQPAPEQSMGLTGA